MNPLPTPTPSGGARIAIRGLTKIFQDREGDVAAAREVTFAVPAGAFFTLLGPSGCGKTTTLRCLAGLERPDAGDITIGDDLVSCAQRHVFVPPHRRQIGMVFQSYAVWPHMSVAENVAFPLQSRGVAATDIVSRVAAALDLVGLSGYQNRPSTRLSGGQQQRVAVARALVAHPKVLLFDEPLSNLDAKLREEMRDELRQLQQRLGITVVYVTHDQQEALAMSDQVAVMSAGRLVEVGTPWEIYRWPRSAFTAEFIGLANRVSGHVETIDAERGLTRVHTDLGTLTCRLPRDLAAVPGAAVLLFIRPEHVAVASQPLAGENALSGSVASAQFLGDCLDCRVRVGQGMLRLRSAAARPIATGDPIYCQIPPETVIILPAG